MRRILSNLIKKRMTFGPLAAKRARGHSFILMYHRVLPEQDCAQAEANHALIVSTKHFDEHLSYLKQNFDIVSLTDIVNAGENSVTKSHRAKLAITFDDGWRDNYEHAWPILKKHGLTATIFLVSEYIGTNKKLWWSALEQHYTSIGSPDIRDWIGALETIATNENFPDIRAALEGLKEAQIHSPEDVIQHLKSTQYNSLEEFSGRLADSHNIGSEPELIDWSHALEMQTAGIEFGAHTQRHELLPLLDDASIQKTVHGSVRTLREQGLNVIDIFSYPNGDNDERTQRAVSETGFKYAVGTRRGTISSTATDAMELPRINIGGGNSADITLLRQRLARAFWLQR